MATIKLSRQQWEFIGKKTGWMKIAVADDPDNVQSRIEGQSFYRVEWQTTLEALRSGGWLKKLQDFFISVGKVDVRSLKSHVLVDWKITEDKMKRRNIILYINKFTFFVHINPSSGVLSFLNNHLKNQTLPLWMNDYIPNPKGIGIRFPKDLLGKAGEKALLDNAIKIDIEHKLEEYDDLDWFGEYFNGYLGYIN